MDAVAPPVTASMVVIGDEILNGSVLDVNSRELGAALAAHGVPLQRCLTVPDNHAEIAAAVRGEVDRGGPRLVVTSGGIGSTPDDITFSAVAAALDVALVRHPDIERRVLDVVHAQRARGVPVGDDVEADMLRMADLPAGASLLDSVSGWVPAVVIGLNGGVVAAGVTVAVLPGVPRSFAHIVKQGLVPMVAGRNPTPLVMEVHHGLPESLLNPLFRKLGDQVPGATLGSYPGSPMRIRLTGAPSDVRRAVAVVTTHLDAMLTDEPTRMLAAEWGGTDEVTVVTP